MPFPHPRVAQDKATDEILWHTGLKVAQAASLALPPLYIVASIIRQVRGHPSGGFSLNRMLRATWMGGTALAVAAPPIAWQVKLKNEPTVAMVDRWERLVSANDSYEDLRELLVLIRFSRLVAVTQRTCLHVCLDKMTSELIRFRTVVPLAARSTSHRRLLPDRCRSRRPACPHTLPSSSQYHPRRPRRCLHRYGRWNRCAFGSSQERGPIGQARFEHDGK